MAMEQLHDCCMRNKLIAHPGKTEAMLMVKKSFTGPLKPIQYGESCVSIVESVKYLDITIDNELTWDRHLSTT